MKHILSALALAGWFLGCTSSANGPGETGGGGGTSSSSGASGGGGSGGVLIEPGPPEPQCDDPTVFLEIAGDVTLSLDASGVPTGYLDHGGGSGSERLRIEAWPAEGDRVITIAAKGVTWPGSTTTASMSFHHAGGDYTGAPAESAALTVTTFGAYHGVIEGSFSGALAATKAGSGPATLSITGTFRLCRGPDVYID